MPALLINAIESVPLLCCQPCKADKIAKIGKSAKSQSEYEEAYTIEPLNYLAQCKKVRSLEAFTTMINQQIGLSKENLESINELLEMTINSIILADDIESGASTRNGFPLAHDIFEVPHTINTVTYVHVAILDKIIDLFPQKCIQLSKVYFDRMIEIHLMTDEEIYWTDANQCPTEKKYIQTTSNKMRAILKMAVEFMQILSDRKRRNFDKLIELQSVYMQVREDYDAIVEFCFANETSGDFQSAKFSLPIVHAVNSDPTNVTFLKLIRQKRNNLSLKKLITTRLEKSGSIEYTKNFLNDLADRLHSEISDLLDKPFICEMIGA